MDSLIKKAYKLYLLQLVFSSTENLINVHFITYKQFKKLYIHKHVIK